MQKTTMTIMDVYTDLRKHGFRSSPKQISNGIASGLYPFGKVLNVGETGRCSFQIRRADYEAWKEVYIYEKTKDDMTAAEAVRVSTVDRELISTHTYTQEDNGTVWEIIIRKWEKQNPE